MEHLPGGSCEEHVILTRRFLFDVMQEGPTRNFDTQCEHLRSRIIEITQCPETSLHVIKHILGRFTSAFQTKWQSSRRTKERFLKNNDKWLTTAIQFPLYIVTPLKISGRPPVDFRDSSERSKRRKTQKLRSEVTTSELSYAAQMNLRASGHTDAAYVVKHVTFSSPKRASKYRKAYEKDKRPVVKLSDDEALSMFVEAKLTRHQYNVVRNQAKQSKCQIFPAYYAIREAKLRCYPHNAIITETSAEVQVQALLDHTVQRIVHLQTELLTKLTREELCNLYLISKWGCDGSSGQSQYKQRFDDVTNSDANIFLTSCVPIQLRCGDPERSEPTVVWQNPRPSSPRFCRPIRLQFVHETTDVTIQEANYIESQVSALMPSIITIEGIECTIKHKMVFTMIDGKVCNAVTSTSSTQRCYLCGATSKDFNKISEVQSKEVDVTNLRFGLSTLHAWIRFFECLLHLAYKSVIGTWQARGKDNKQKVADNKKIIQEELKAQLGLVVDRPKPGYGSTNDGNTARRFFENIQVSAAITGIDEDVIKRFKVVLQTISSGYDINIPLFEKYALDTARLFVNKYPWYNMPTTVHKILIHGPLVISSAILPIGQLSEEAQEARNKDIKKYREGFARKCSRRKTLEDVFHLLLVSSDPYISSIRELPKKKRKVFSKDVLNMLLPPKVTVLRIESDESNDEEEEEDEGTGEGDMSSDSETSLF